MSSPRAFSSMFSLAAGLLGALAVGAAALAATPVGSEFQVNTYTTGSQWIPSVAVDADGDFVVVWGSPGSAGSDTSGGSIQGQRYDASGNAVGSEFQVNTYTTSTQTYPAVSVEADGDFVVVWQSWGSAGSDNSYASIQGQRYDAGGNAVGSQFQVNTYTTNYQRSPAVAADADGDFVVVWESWGSSGSDSSEFSVQGQRYDASGSAVGSEFQVNTYTTSYQVYPAVAAHASGDFVVVWMGDGSAGSDSDWSVQGQRYDASGNALGSEFQVNTYTTGTQGGPSVALDADGDFVVVWQSYGSAGSDGSAFSVQGQLYDASGAVLGSEFQVNTYTTGDQGDTSVGIDADGDFVVVWASMGSAGSDTSGDSIQGQRYTSAGGPVRLEATHDAFISMQDPNLNYGSGTALSVRNRYGSGGSDYWERNTLAKFDLSSIPPGSTITSATLHLYYYHCIFSNCTGRSLNCRRLTSSWDEDTVTWNTRPGIASTVTDQATVPSSFDWMEWDVTGDVQAVVNGTAVDEGWQISDEVAWGSSNIPDERFYSKEYGDYVPYLEIVYASGPRVPSLTRWGFMTLALLLLALAMSRLPASRA